MKRCPQCHFIYPDEDEICDFDQAPLVDTAESEIAAITNTPERPALADLAATHSRKSESRKNRRTLPIAAALGLVLGLVVFGVYFAVHRQMTPQQVAEQANVNSTQPVVQLPSSSPSSSPAQTLETEPTDETNTKVSNANAKTTAAHSATGVGPVSTRTPGTTNKTGGKRVILLTTGGRLEADEVWRTKDGVWYRRDGVVTLLKKNRVKAIVNQ
jgi:hypothetical protein